MNFKVKYQRGAQAVEFALVLPFFLALLLLIIDFGFLVYNKAVITNASREGARAGTVLTAVPWTTTAVAAVACNYAKNSLITTSSGTHTSSCGGTADPVIVVSNPNGNVPPHFGDPVSVRVTYPYQGLLKSLISPSHTSPQTSAIESAWSLTASSTMNHE
jgi:Flp pilus assembly protein TadG